VRRAALLLAALLAGCGKPAPPATSASTAADEARRLLAEAGFPGGKGFPKLTLVYNTSESHKRIAAAVQERWRRELGVELELANAEWKVFLERVHAGDFDVARRAWIGEYLDPHAFLDLFTSGSGQNPTGWRSEDFDRRVRESDAERDPAKRRAMLDAAEDLLLREAPIAPVYHYVAHNWLKPFVKGFHPNSRDMHPLQDLRLEGEGAPADGTLVFNAGEEPRSLDPAVSSDIAGLKVLMNLFEGLADYDPKDASPRPAAAERWEASADGLTWTFHLREGRWSNGDPVGASDFVYAWRRVLDKATGSDYGHRLNLIKGAREVAAGRAPPESLGVRAAGERTLVVELEHPAPYFAQLVCLNLFYPVHRATVERHGRAWTKPENLTGNGPYRLADWKVNDRKVFVKSPTWRGADGLKLEKAVFLSIPDASTALRAYEAGQVHWLFQAPNDQMDVLKSRPDYHPGPANSVYFFAFNVRRKPLDDPRVRRALALTIDRPRIVQALLRGGETPADRLTPPSSR
jgi:ABC-type oligopeptide transport system substrate-binding subunit